MLSQTGVIADALAAAHATTEQAAALLSVLHEVAASGYRFTTPTPQTHQRYLTHRGDRPASTLRDIFGWSLPFAASAVAPSLLKSMRAAGILGSHGSRMSSTIRIASLDDDLFLHSAYPTNQASAVFFGPDTYRFIRFIRQALQTNSQLHSGPPLRILDIGCGSGAGGILAARVLADVGQAGIVTMNDINALALYYTNINARFAKIPIQLVYGDVFATVAAEFDLIISNPPYLADAAQRTYRNGGARLGRALSVRIVAHALAHLAPGGSLLLYTGVAIIDGIDPFRAEVLPLLAEFDFEYAYEEIDPDIFGEELEQPIYAHADRIAAVGLTVHRKLG